MVLHMGREVFKGKERQRESKKKEKMALRNRKDGIQQIIQKLLKKRDKRNLNNGCIIIVVNYCMAVSKGRISI